MSHDSRLCLLAAMADSIAKEQFLATLPCFTTAALCRTEELLRPSARSSQLACFAPCGARVRPPTEAVAAAGATMNPQLSSLARCSVRVPAVLNPSCEACHAICSGAGSTCPDQTGCARVCARGVPRFSVLACARRKEKNQESGRCQAMGGCVCVRARSVVRSSIPHTHTHT